MANGCDFHAGVYMLAREHAQALQRLAADPSLAALVGIAHPPRDDAGTEAVERLSAHRTEGKAYWSAIVDGGVVKGVSALLDPYDTAPRIVVWIDPSARRRGYGTLALRLALEFAFRNLQRAGVHVVVAPNDEAAERTIAPFGFVALAESGPHGRRWELTRAQWVAARDRPALAKLHPDLRAILAAELAAGNEVIETGGGWPDADSVFVRLRDPFRTKPASLPTGIVYTEPNDPHWWKADYTSEAPRHTLAC